VNARTTLTADGQIPIPKDVRERMKLVPGAPMEIDEVKGVLRLKSTVGVFRPDLPRTTMADLRKRPKWQGEPKSIEEISRLSDEALREIFAEQERRARD
jgi:AbrB family looped-hinge helix DNA binding protein